MGNFFSKRNSYSSEYLELPLLDIPINNQISDEVRQDILNYVGIMRNEIGNLINKVDGLNTRIDDMNSSYQGNIYNINEQVNLINKDLQSLLNNDKLLLEKYIQNIKSIKRLIKIIRTRII